MTRISSRRHWLRSWANLALFALISLLASPAFAWNCCCDDAPETSVHAHAKVSESKAHDGCEKAISVSTQTASPTISGQVISSVACDCQTAQTLVAAPPEPAKTPFFAPVWASLVTPAPHYWGSGAILSLDFAVFSLPPPRSHPDSTRGRAPPVLALS